MQGPAGPLCRINETEQTEGYYPAGVTSTSMYARGVTHWYVYDGLGSVIAELDDNNNVTTSGQYDVYGTPRPGTRQGGSPTSSQGYVGELGHVTDASTGGLIYMQARYYDPGLGRFVSEDTGANGNNWYVYADCNPVCNGDQTGKADVSLITLGWNLIQAGVKQLSYVGNYLVQAASYSWRSMMCDESTIPGAIEKADLSAMTAMFGDLAATSLTQGLGEIVVGMSLIYMGIMSDDGGSGPGSDEDAPDPEYD